MTTQLLIPNATIPRSLRECVRVMARILFPIGAREIGEVEIGKLRERS